MLKKLICCFTRAYKEECLYYKFLEQNINLFKFDADYNALD